MNAIEAYLAVLAALETFDAFHRARQRRDSLKRAEVINAMAAAMQAQLDRELGVERRENVR